MGDVNAQNPFLRPDGVPCALGGAKQLTCLRKKRLSVGRQAYTMGSTYE